tara:strand:- start:994 stop:1122 length:129 start_codon:yes stop_codon:yes gene_type:complete
MAGLSRKMREIGLRYKKEKIMILFLITTWMGEAIQLNLYGSI